MKHISNSAGFYRRHLVSGTSLMVICLCLGFLPSTPFRTFLYAADYPSHPITLVVPLAPGGETDTVARLFANFLGKSLKQPVVVLNKSGGQGLVGGKYVASSRPDGYTLAFLSPLAMFPEMYSSEPSYLSDAIQPISGIYEAIMPIAVRSDAPWNSFKDLIKYAKENPGMKVGIQATDSPAWILLSNINKQEGTKFVNATFGGGAEIITALLGGHVPIGAPAYSRLRPLVDANKLKALVILSRKRLEFAPDIPTGVELGYRLLGRVYMSLSGPAGLPAEIVKKLDEATRAILEDPAFRKKANEMFVQVDYEGAATIKKSLKQDAEDVHPVLKELGIVKK